MVHTKVKPIEAAWSTRNSCPNYQCKTWPHIHWQSQKRIKTYNAYNNLLPVWLAMPKKLKQEVDLPMVNIKRSSIFPVFPVKSTKDHVTFVSNPIIPIIVWMKNHHMKQKKSAKKSDSALIVFLSTMMLKIVKTRTGVTNVEKDITLFYIMMNRFSPSV